MSPHSTSYDTVIDTLANLGPIQRRGQNAKARCPAHDDRQPSLSVTYKARQTLLYCFAGIPILTRVTHTDARREATNHPDR